MKNVVIIDYGLGNTHSVFNAITLLEYKVKISSKQDDFLLADAFILPGVGAFNEAMQNFNKRNLLQTLEKEVFEKKKPLLGICVGMQMLATYSDENGRHNGLNWIPGAVEKLELPKEYSVPHVGWNDVVILKESPLFLRNTNKSHFYFDHSYHFCCEQQFTSAFCDYGQEVVSAIQKDNIYGVQFHPEKSQLNGLKLLKSFLLNC